MRQLMADFNVIGDVSVTLRNVLTAGLAILLPGPPPVAEISDLQMIPPNQARLTICLYDVIEDPSARNRPRERGLVGTAATERKPPMTLLLRYILTPWAGDRLTEQRILGRALQVLYDGAILSGPQLAGGLQGRVDTLKITMSTLSLEDRAWFWQAVQKPYHLSAVYEVRVVEIDSEVEQRRSPVANRNLGYSVAEA
jgi:hypothetical protein